MIYRRDWFINSPITIASMPKNDKSKCAHLIILYVALTFSQQTSANGDCIRFRTNGYNHNT